MGRMKKAWYYERQAQQATARDNYYRDRVPPESSDIESRGASTDLYYRSLIQIEGTDHVIYTVSVPNTTLAKVTASEAGLMTALGTDDVALRLRGSGMKPTKLHWYKGATTATRRRTAWNTSVARYYDTESGRSHYSIPFSRATGVFNADDLKDAFVALVGPSGSKKTTLLGAVNGRAYIEWERVTVSAQT